MKDAAAWLRERLADARATASSGSARRRSPPKVEPPLAPQDPQQLARRCGCLPSSRRRSRSRTWRSASRPCSQFLERFRAVLRRRTRFDFDGEVGRLPRVEQAVAFLALLELRRAGEITIDQAAPFAPIRVARAGEEIIEQRRKDRGVDRPLRLIAANPLDQLARTIEALLVVASAPLPVQELAEAADDDPGARRGRARPRRRALPRGAQRRRARARRRRLGVPRLPRGRGGVRAPVRAAGAAQPLAGCARDARHRRLPRPLLAPGHRPHPRRRRRLRRRRSRRARPDRRGGPRRRSGGAIRYRTTPLFERVFGLESLSELPRLDDIGADAERSASGWTRSRRSEPPRRRVRRAGLATSRSQASIAA